MKLTNRNLGSTLAAAGLLSCTAVLTAWADYPSAVLAHNPLAYWRLDETAMAPALNTVSNSGTLGSAGTGYAVMDATKGEPGIVGTCIRFNNPGVTIGHCGSKVNVPYNPALNPAPPFSIEFWAKPNALPVSDTTGVCPLSSFDNNWYGDANRSGWLFYVNNAGRWNFRLGLTSGYAANVLGTSGNATVGTWQHIVATWDDTTVLIYANGVQIASAPASVAATGWQPNPQTALRMGGTALTGDLDVEVPAISDSGHSGNRGWDGWVDEVAIYTKVLSPSTIAAHHDAASTNTADYGAQILADAPVGYWNLGEPAVTTPDPSAFPVVSNLGSAGADANGTLSWGTLSDQSGSGYAGFGATNQACFFDGENGGITINDAAGLHFSGNVTLMAWIKPIEQDFFRDIIAHGMDANAAETFLRISRGSGGTGAGDGNYYEVGVTDGSSYYDSVLVPIPPGDIGNWVFLAGTYDGANWNLYRNGVLIGSYAGSEGDTGNLDVTNRWSIGSRSDPTPGEGLRFGGWIDEPAIFKTALSASDINALYNAANVSPVITAAPVPPSGPVYEGSVVSFSVWAEGSPTLYYQWLKDGTPLTGQNATNLVLNGVKSGSSGTYSVVVTNAYGSITSSVPLTVLTSPPLITQQPQSLTRFPGAQFIFQVQVIGSTPLSFQWSANGAPIAGATFASYTNTAAAGPDTPYTCTITNVFGSTNTDAATLSVLPAPSAYPAAVLGDKPLSYWRLGETNGAAAHDYWGGNDGIYHGVTLGVPGYSTLDPDTAAEFGAVNVYVGNISGTAVNFSGHVNFSLEAWVKGPAGQSDESTIIAKGNGSGGGGTTATEQFGLDVIGGYYHFFTRGGGNSIYEATAQAGPNGTWQHVVGVYDDSGIISGSPSMYIYVDGQQSGSGATRAAGLRVSSDPVSIGSKHLGNDPAYDGYWTGTINEVAVYPVALTQTQIQTHYGAAYGSSLAPFISIQPVSLTNYVSLAATFSVGAAGTVPLSLQWSKDGVAISGATLDTLTISPLAPSDAGSYTVNISNGLGSTNSAPATLTVLQPPTTAPAIPGLVLHLPFDNNLTDTTGRGNNAVGIHISGSSSNVAAPTYVGDGAIGSALHFSTDMSTTNNSYVTLGLRPDLQFSSNVNFTLAYWIRSPQNYVGADLPFISTAIGSTFSPGLVLAYSYGLNGSAIPAYAGSWCATIFDLSGNGIGGYGEVGAINDGNWHHLVHVFDRKKGLFNYLDGLAVPFHKEDGGTSEQAAGDIDTGNWFTIGQDPTGTYSLTPNVVTASGDIDDIGIWRRALTPLEAASIFMAGASNKLSFAYSPPVTNAPTLTLQRVGSQVQLSWDVGTLYSANNVTGPYTTVVSTTSPYVITPTSSKKFYRAGP